MTRKVRSHLTKREETRVGKFACDIAQTMLLPAYHFSIADEPTDEGNIAHIVINEQRYNALIYLSVDWMNRPEDERMNAVIHEVVHVLLHKLMAHAYVIEDSLPTQTYEDWKEHLRLESEFVCDHFANVVMEYSLVQQRWKELGKKKGKRRAAGTSPSLEVAG